ncbi:MAG TPA: PqqD family protein [bacterium (Candidatus Stahlbacteria)]|nr:PqqD family protein [Candidatus Stahlbacteria bacterium]
MKREILQMTPVRFLDFWKIEGEPPFGLITVRGISGIYKLNELSSFIWLCLDGSNTVEKIITAICRHFSDAERGQVEEDVVLILKSMDNDDLIILDYNPLYPYKELVTLKKGSKRPGGSGGNFKRQISQ